MLLIAIKGFHEDEEVMAGIVKVKRMVMEGKGKRAHACFRHNSQAMYDHRSAPFDLKV